MVYMYNGVVFICKEEYHPVSCSQMDGTREHCIKWYEPEIEREVLLVPTHMWKQTNKQTKKVDLKVEWLLGTGKSDGGLGGGKGFMYMYACLEIS
jgi:hypothetical protein